MDKENPVGLPNFYIYGRRYLKGKKYITEYWLPAWAKTAFLFKHTFALKSSIQYDVTNTF